MDLSCFGGDSLLIARRDAVSGPMCSSVNPASSTRASPPRRAVGNSRLSSINAGSGPICKRAASAYSASVRAAWDGTFASLIKPGKQRRRRPARRTTRV